MTNEQKVAAANTGNDGAPDGDVVDTLDRSEAPAKPDAAEAETPASSDEELARLRDELVQVAAKAEENWSLYLAARAEVDNVRKRGERDLANAHKFALEKFIIELLPVKDSLELGISAAADSTDIDKLKEGEELTLKMLGSALEKFGVQAIDPIGSRFDPELHEAVAMQPAADVEPNTVLQVIQKGYRLNDRLVRPALVIVAQATG